MASVGSRVSTLAECDACTKLNPLVSSQLTSKAGRVVTEKLRRAVPLIAGARAENSFGWQILSQLGGK